MHDLGTQEPDYSGEIATPSKDSQPKKTKTVYPSLNLKDSHLDSFGKNLPKVGHTGKATIKYRVSRHEDNGDKPKYGGAKKQMDLEVTHIEHHGDTLDGKDFED